MVIEPSNLVAAQPSCAAAALHQRIVDVEVRLDRAGDQLMQLGRGQRGGLDFFPAASPDSGTTRPAATGFGDDATRPSSSPDSPPSPPRPWLASGTPRSDALPSSPAPVPSEARRERNWKDNSHA